jgi:hypothetical protein
LSHLYHKALQTKFGSVSAPQQLTPAFRSDVQILVDAYEITAGGRERAFHFPQSQELDGRVARAENADRGTRWE